MNFIVDQRSLEVGKVGEFSELPGVAHNGQHLQLPGKILAEMKEMEEIKGGVEFIFLHPDTDGADTGHFDVRFVIGKGEAWLERYSGFEKLSLANRELLMLWPDGPEHFLEVVRSMGGVFYSSPDHVERDFGRVINLAANNLV